MQGLPCRPLRVKDGHSDQGIMKAVLDKSRRAWSHGRVQSQGFLGVKAH